MLAYLNADQFSFFRIELLFVIKLPLMESAPTHGAYPASGFKLLFAEFAQICGFGHLPIVSSAKTKFKLRAAVVAAFGRAVLPNRQSGV